MDGVAVDDGPVLLEVFGGEAALVDDLHLLHDGALPRLARTLNGESFTILLLIVATLTLTKKSGKSVCVKEAMIGTRR